MKPEITFLTTDDIAQATTLYIDVFSKAPWCEQNDYDDIFRYITRLLQMNTNRCYVYKKSDHIIAMALGYVKPWHLGVEYQLDNFFVDANYQGQGVETELLVSIKNDLIKNDIPAIILETESHTPAEKFYRHNGFDALAAQRSLTLTCQLIS